MNAYTTLTELDAAIIAEEQGWEYLPACDEAELLLAEAEEIKAVASAQPDSDIVIDPFVDKIAPKVNKRHLRAQLSSRLPAAAGAAAGACSHQQASRRATQRQRRWLTGSPVLTATQSQSQHNVAFGHSLHPMTETGASRKPAGRMLLAEGLTCSGLASHGAACARLRAARPTAPVRP